MTAVRRDRTPFELTLLLGSIAAILALVLTLAVSALTGPTGPADLRTGARLTGELRNGGFVVEAYVRNAGGRTAENVVISVTLGDETLEAEIVSVAKGDEETVTFSFPPGATGTPLARLLSHHEPARQ